NPALFTLIRAHQSSLLDCLFYGPLAAFGECNPLRVSLPPLGHGGPHVLWMGDTPRLVRIAVSLKVGGCASAAFLVTAGYCCLILRASGTVSAVPFALGCGVSVGVPIATEQFRR